MSSVPLRRHAAAIAYDAADAKHRQAPRVIAKGHGLVADEIIERARVAGVPIHQSRELAALLTQVDLEAPSTDRTLTPASAVARRSRAGPSQGSPPSPKRSAPSEASSPFPA